MALSVKGLGLALLAPFKGVRFDPARVAVERAVAPPYDVVGPDMEQDLLAGEEHNIIRITLAKTPAGGRDEQEYGRAAERLRAWRRDGALLQDPLPAIYVVEQTFTVAGERLCRLGFVAALLLEEFSAGNVRPHERTMAAPKSDRLKLYEACRANLSQVLTVYSDPRGEAARTVGELRQGDPLMAVDYAGVAHRVWRVTDRDAITSLTAMIRPQPLFIADGHHRYESALRHRALYRSGDGPPGSAPEDYIGALCISVADPGLRVLPTHRGVRMAGAITEQELVARLGPHFVTRKVHVAGPGQVEQAFQRERAGQQVVGLYMPGGALYVLEPKGAAYLTALKGRFPDHADSWWQTPVGLLHYAILPDACGVQPGSAAESQDVEYLRDAAVVAQGVESGRCALAFLLPPTDPRTIEHVAQAGQRMPMKSTYFYPKILSGLVLYVHEAGANCPGLPLGGAA